MSEPKINDRMEKIVSLCKRRGFIFQSSEIYGGINGFWDYGPLGAELKRNVKELWWRRLVHERDDVAGLEATIIMAPQIWRASGHTSTFNDPMVDCKACKKRFRADQIEPKTGTVFKFSGAVTEKWIHRISEALIENEDEQVRKLSNSLLQDDYDFSNDIVRTYFAKESQLRKELDKLSLEHPGEATREYSNQDFSVLIPHGKRRSGARRLAKQFYLNRGVIDPIPLPEAIDEVQDDILHCAEPNCGGDLTPPQQFNLMFKSYAGPVESDENIVYLRPETAQAIFVQFKNVLETARQKVPFGVAQIGKAFRNEINPRNFTFRSREFEQMELEFFIKPDEAVEAINGSITKVPETGHPGEPQPNWGWQAWHQYWVEERVRFYEGIGLSRQTLGFHRQTAEELAHYARACVDILFKFPFSKRNEQGELIGEELEGIAARSDFDLSQHQRFSGKSMGVFDEELKSAWSKLDEEKKSALSNRYLEARRKYFVKMGESAEKAEKQAGEEAAGLAKGNYIPHVIEPSAGVDRLILALICNAYAEDQAPDEKGNLESRIVMRFHPRIAPIKVAIFPLLKNKPELVKKAKDVRDLLRPHLTVSYDETGAIGRRYRRQDEAGTPFGITIDFDTLGEKPELLNTVTLRDRDSMQQTRVKIDELLPILQEKIR